MPRNDIFCNYLNLKQKILSQPKNVQGDTWFFKKFFWKVSENIRKAPVW